jgi:hypothetical protein
MIHINIRQATHPHAPTGEGRPPLPAPSPWAYQDIVAAVQQGVMDAVAEHLDTYGLVQS